jgi:phenylpyruvate tautomerase PptA (4-oxalocrotonate tautomerase family)
VPIAHLYVVDPSADQRRRLGSEATRIYAEALDAPLDRIRVYIVGHQPEEVTVAGVGVDQGGAAAPYFTAVVLEGRSAAQRHAVMRGMSTLLAQVMHVDLAVVRGRIIRCDPEDWAIAGESASVVRATEITDRSRQEETA